MYPLNQTKCIQVREVRENKEGLKDSMTKLELNFLVNMKIGKPFV